MKKYKLLKDLPGVEKGLIFEPAFNSKSYRPTMGVAVDYPKALIECYPDWFEEVVERWRPRPNQRFYHFDALLDSVFDTEYLEGMEQPLLFHCGNCFKEFGQAKEAAKRVKACLMEYHKELADEKRAENKRD